MPKHKLTEFLFWKIRKHRDLIRPVHTIDIEGNWFCSLLLPSHIGGTHQEHLPAGHFLLGQFYLLTGYFYRGLFYLDSFFATLILETTT